MSHPDTAKHLHTAERLQIFRRLQMMLALLCWSATATTLWAGGPRWVTGPPFFTQSGTSVVWYTNQPLYFTDPGDLSSSVNHACGGCDRRCGCRGVERPYVEFSTRARRQSERAR